MQDLESLNTFILLNCNRCNLQCTLGSVRVAQYSSCTVHFSKKVGSVWDAFFGCTIDLKENDPLTRSGNPVLRRQRFRNIYINDVFDDSSFQPLSPDNTPLYPKYGWWNRRRKSFPMKRTAPSSATLPPPTWTFFWLQIQRSIEFLQRNWYNCGFSLPLSHLCRLIQNDNQ